jgi:hypothetical protein
MGEQPRGGNQLEKEIQIDRLEADLADARREIVGLKVCVCVCLYDMQSAHILYKLRQAPSETAATSVRLRSRVYFCMYTCICVYMHVFMHEMRTLLQEACEGLWSYVYFVCMHACKPV